MSCQNGKVNLKTKEPDALLLNTLLEEKSRGLFQVEALCEKTLFDKTILSLWGKTPKREVLLCSHVFSQWGPEPFKADK